MRVFLFTVLGASVAFAQMAPKAASKTGAAKSVATTNPKLLTPAALKAPAPPEFKVKFTTTKGDFVLDVHRDWSPNGADRFYNLVRVGYFDNVRFFRAVKDFMVQFGLSGRIDVNRAWLSANIKDDPAKAGIGNKRGFISFAAAGPNTRTTQVFINLVDNSRLDPMGFTPFGEVVDGMDTIDKFYMDYGDAPSSDQTNIMNGGEAYVAKRWPNTDKIVTARLAGAPAAPAPVKKAAPAVKKPAPAVKKAAPAVKKAAETK